MNDRGSAVLLVTIDFDPVHGAEIIDWLDNEHLPGQMVEQGYRPARRFRADGDPSRFLVVYELDDSAAAFMSPANQAEGSGPNKTIVAKWNACTRAVWEEVAASESSGTGRAVLVVTIEIDPVDDEEFNRWYDQEHFADRLGQDGFISGRRFRLHGDPSKFLVLYQLDEAASATKPEYMQNEPSDWSKDVMSRWKDWSRSVWTEI